MPVVHGVAWSGVVLLCGLAVERLTAVWWCRCCWVLAVMITVSGPLQGIWLRGCYFGRVGERLPRHRVGGGCVGG